MFNITKNKDIDEVLKTSDIQKKDFSQDFQFGESLFFFGDNLSVLAKLVQETNFRGKVDLVYIDPPFNTNREFKVSQERNNSISSSTDGDIAYSDNLSRSEYFQFLHDRLILLYQMLSDNGSIYLHIDTKVGHYVKIILDNIFGEENFINDITRIKSNPKNFARKAYGNEKDMILFYSKVPNNNIWNEIKVPLSKLELETRFKMIDDKGRMFTTIPLHAPGETKDGVTGQEWRGMLPPSGRHWRTDPKHFDELDKNGDIHWSSTGNPRIKKYAEDHSGVKIQDVWTYKDPQNPKYPTEKNIDMLKMIIRQSSNKDGYVLDCFAGSGSTLLAAELNGRKWIGIDNSPISIETVKSRKDLKNFKIITLI